MHESMQNDSMDYNDPEYNVNGDFQQEQVFDDAFDEMVEVKETQFLVDENQQVIDQGFEGQLYDGQLYEDQVYENQVYEDQSSYENQVFEAPEILPLEAQEDLTSKRGFGLRNKILLLLVVLVTSSLGASLISTLMRVRTSHFENLHTNRLLAAEVVEGDVANFFDKNISQLLGFGSTQLMQESLVERNQSYIDNYGDDYNLILQEINTREDQWLNAGQDDPLVNSIVSNDPEVNVASHQLFNFTNTFSEYSNFVLTDQHGAAVASTAVVSDYYHADEAWWKAAWADGKGEVYISEAGYDPNTNTNGFIVALPLFSDTGDLLGVMRSTLNVAGLEASIAKPTDGETGHAILLDKNANVLIDPGLASGHNASDIPLSTRQALANSNQESLDLIDEAGERSMFVTLGINGSIDAGQANNVTGDYADISEATNYLRSESLSQAINDLGLTLAIRQKYSEASQVVQDAIRLNSIIFILTLLATLFLGVIFARRLTKPLNHLVDVMKQVGSGDLSTLAEIDTKDEIGILANSVNDTVVKLRDVVRTERERDEAQENSEMLQGSISGFLDVITDVAQGDLTRRGEVSADILGNVIDATNVMVEEVGFLLNNVKQTATQVGTGAQNMITSSESISQSNQSRVHTANQLAQAVHSVSQSMQQMAGQVDTAAATALQTYSASQEGSLVVKDTLVGMQNIRQEVQTIAKRIKNLGDRSLEISEIVETIRHLASQTNLLALNAAIEAAGAGEAGGRFAIVADEVRKLAENSAQATERVSTLIQSVQEEVQDVVISVEDGIREVEGGYELATQAGQRLDDIGQQAQSSAGLAQKIAQLVKEQVERVGIVNSNLQMMSSSGTQSQQVVAEGKQIAEQLQTLSQELLESLSHFRLDETQLVD